MTVGTTNHIKYQAIEKLQADGALEKPVKDKAEAPPFTGREPMGWMF